MTSYHDELDSIMAKYKTRYISPIPLKKQRVVHHRGRSNKPKIYSPEEVFLYKLKLYSKAMEAN